MLWGNTATAKKGAKKKKAPKKPTQQDKIDMLIMGKSIKGKGKVMSTIPPPKDAVERACSMKEELLEQIEGIGERLPPNTLDQLIDELGGPDNVAEVNYFKNTSTFDLHIVFSAFIHTFSYDSLDDWT